MSDICTNTSIRRAVSGVAYTAVMDNVGKSQNQKDYFVNTIAAVATDAIPINFFEQMVTKKDGNDKVMTLLGDSLDTALTLYVLHMVVGGSKNLMNSLTGGIGIELTDMLMKMVFNRACE